MSERSATTLRRCLLAAALLLAANGPAAADDEPSGEHSSFDAAVSREPVRAHSASLDSVSTDTTPLEHAPRAPARGPVETRPALPLDARSAELFPDEADDPAREIPENAELTAALERLEKANETYATMLSRDYPRGEARKKIVNERIEARDAVERLTASQPAR